MEASSLVDHLAVFLTSAILHGLLFFISRWIFTKSGLLSYRQLPFEQQVEWDSRVVSNIQAVLATAGAVRWLWVDWHTIEEDADFAFGGSDIRHFYMMITAGYLLYDLVLCLWHFRTLGEPTTLIHHTVILVAYSLGLSYHVGTFYMGFFLVNEISTPFLNFRWFLFMSGRHTGRLYDWNVNALALTFFVSRVVLNLIAVEHMTRGYFRFYASLFASGNPMWLVQLLIALAWAHVLINLYWFWLILEKILRKFGFLKGPRNPQKQHHRNHHKDAPHEPAKPSPAAQNGTHTKSQKED